MKKRSSTPIWEVKADHDGWEAEIEQMTSTVDYLFADVRHEITRYNVVGYDGRTIAVGCETWSEAVLKRVRKLKWPEVA
jgi:hypothetical protein